MEELDLKAIGVYRDIVDLLAVAKAGPFAEVALTMQAMPGNTWGPVLTVKFASPPYAAPVTQENPVIRQTITLCDGDATARVKDGTPLVRGGEPVGKVADRWYKDGKTLILVEAEEVLLLVQDQFAAARPAGEADGPIPEIKVY